LKPRDEPTPFKLDTSLPLYAQACAIVQAVADGELNTTDGKLLLDMVHGLVAIKNVDELAQRITALEEAAQSASSSSAAAGGVLTT
jgi:hypothetical protein